jgi:paraquat-inducible protein A
MSTQKSGFPILPAPGNMSDTVVVCLECDALHQRQPLATGEAARCIRCGAVLYRHPWLRREQLLALVVAALVTFVIANSYPIVNLQVQGIDNSATLFGSILALWHEGRMVVAVLVFATTLLFPLIDLVVLLILLVLVRQRHPPPVFAPMLRFIQTMRPWGMTEVFMLGVVVALVKLSHMAHILPGVALWAFGVLTLLLAAIISFDLRTLWHGFERSDPL